MKDRYERVGKAIKNNHKHQPKAFVLSDREHHLDLDELDKLVEHLNDKEDLIDDLNKEEQRLVTIIQKDKDEIADLKRKNDRLQYIIFKQKELINVYNNIWQYVEEYE